MNYTYIMCIMYIVLKIFTHCKKIVNKDKSYNIINKMNKPKIIIKKCIIKIK